MDRDFRLWVWLWVWFYFPIVIGVGVGLWVVGLSSMVFFPLLVRFLSVLSASSSCFCLRFGCDFRLWVWLSICSLNQFLAQELCEWTSDFVKEALVKSVHENHDRNSSLVLLCLGDTILSIHRTGKFSVFSVILSVFQCLVLILSIFCSYVMFAML